MKAMIFAAGLGTRLRPLTDTMPKALIPVNGKPVLQHVIERLKLHGFDNLIINLHHFPQQIIDFLESNDNFGCTIAFSNEHDRLLDTGGGLKAASWFFDSDEPFLVHNADILSAANLSVLYATHLRQGGLATLAVNRRETSRVFLFDGHNRLWGWKNRQTGEVKTHAASLPPVSPLSFCGIHVVSPQLFTRMTEQGVFSIVEVYLRLAPDFQIRAFEIAPDDYWFDIGTKEKLAEADKFLAGQLF